MRLSYLTLGCAELTSAVRFYRALGLRQRQDSTPQLAFFELGGLVLALMQERDLARELGVEGAGTRVCLCHNVPTRGDVRALLARAQGAGARITRAASVAPWGIYRGYFVDPAGHAWEIATEADQ